MPTRRNVLAASAALALPLPAAEAATIRNSQPSPAPGQFGLETVCHVPASGPAPRVAELNGIAYFPVVNYNVVWDGRGPVYFIEDGLAYKMEDFSRIRPHLAVNPKDARSGGIRWIAEHPDSGRWYVSSLEYPADRDCPIYRGPYPNTFHACIWEFDPATRRDRDILAISMYSRYHPIDTLTFRPGGNDDVLWACVGDGGYLTTQAEGDPYNQAQNPASPLGKVITLNAGGSGAYFMFAMGLRHPMHLNWLPDGRGILTDIGALSFEKIHHLKGANYGWRNYEGIPPVPYKEPIVMWDRRAIDRAVAICGGPYLSSGALAGRVMFGDIPSGRIFRFDAGAIAAAEADRAQLQFEELLLRPSLQELAGSNRVDMRLGRGKGGNLLTIDKRTGTVRRLIELS